MMTCVQDAAAKEARDDTYRMLQPGKHVMTCVQAATATEADLVG